MTQTFNTPREDATTAPCTISSYKSVDRLVAYKPHNLQTVEPYIKDNILTQSILFRPDTSISNSNFGSRKAMAEERNTNVVPDYLFGRDYMSSVR